jgi:hypothetical protein
MVETRGSKLRARTETTLANLVEPITSTISTTTDKSKKRIVSDEKKTSCGIKIYKTRTQNYY